MIGASWWSTFVDRGEGHFEGHLENLTGIYVHIAAALLAFPCSTFEARNGFCGIDMRCSLGPLSVSLHIHPHLWMQRSLILIIITHTGHSSQCCSTLDNQLFSVLQAERNHLNYNSPLDTTGFLTLEFFLAHGLDEPIGKASATNLSQSTERSFTPCPQGAFEAGMDM